MSNDKEKHPVSMWALIGKFFGKGLTIGLKLFKMFKFGILAGLAFTSYSYLLSWKFAILILLAVGWHEQGHVIAMKRCGFKEAKFIFLPFIGGVSYSKTAWKTHWDTVFIAISGPVAGFVLALGAYVCYIATNNPLFAAATSWICLMNLFNLFPISPFDGGHIAKSISLSFHNTKGMIAFGVVSVIALYFLIKLHIVLFCVFGLVGLVELVFSYFVEKNIIKDVNENINRIKFDLESEKWKSDKMKSYKNEELSSWKEKLNASIIPMTTKQILISALGYGSLVAVLILLMQMTANIPGADLAANFMSDK